MKYKQYSNYKDSGVEWLGILPEEWSHKKIKYIAQTVPGGTPSTSEPTYWDGDIPWLPSGAVQNCIITNEGVKKFITKKGLYNSATKYIKPNSTLIALTGATCSNIGYLTFNSTANQSVVGIETQKSTHDKYVFYSLISQKSQILVKRTGGAQAGINEQDVKDIFISYPPLQEQQQISNFLDNATSKIDTLIEKQTKLIELLKEKRQAVISQAVTKGLDPNVPMKDSGVEWLGEIPEHWEISRLGWNLVYISYGFTNPMPTTDIGPKMLTANDIQYGSINYTTARSTNIYDYKNLLTSKSKPKKNDVLLTKDGTLGRVALHDGTECCINQSVALLRPLEFKLNSTYLANALLGRQYQDRMIYEAGGTTIKHIYISRLSQMPFVLPPIEEQTYISNYVIKQNKQFDTLIEKSNKAIELLKEKRTALISSAVTGKIDVREVS